MIAPAACGACGTIAHAPTRACPEPFVCLSGPHCPHWRCLDALMVKAVARQVRRRLHVPPSTTLRARLSGATS